MNDKALILSLIKDDIINSKLVIGLNGLGLDATNYFLHLSETIFRLMGFEDNEHNDEIYEKYLELTKTAAVTCISESHQSLDNLALNIYTTLVNSKSEC